MSGVRIFLNTTMSAGQADCLVSEWQSSFKGFIASSVTTCLAEQANCVGNFCQDKVSGLLNFAVACYFFTMFVFSDLNASF